MSYGASGRWAEDAIHARFRSEPPRFLPPLKDMSKRTAARAQLDPGPNLLSTHPIDLTHFSHVPHRPSATECTQTGEVCGVLARHGVDSAREACPGG